MYKFRDVTQEGMQNRSSIQTVFDGVNLDATISEFRTLRVSGREIVNRNIDTTNYKTRNAGGKSNVSRNFHNTQASVFLSSSLAGRSILVTYEVTARSNEQYRRIYDLLNQRLHVEQARLMFTDDPDYYYIATLSKATDPDGSRNSIVATFDFECSDPYKYSKQREFKFMQSGNFLGKFAYPIVIDEIKITTLVSATKLMLLNITNGQKIILDGAFFNGTVITLRPQTQEILRNGVITPIMMDLLSDFETFDIVFQDNIQTSVNANVVVTYRERIL